MTSRWGWPIFCGHSHPRQGLLAKSRRFVHEKLQEAALGRWHAPPKFGATWRLEHIYIYIYKVSALAGESSKRKTHTVDQQKGVDLQQGSAWIFGLHRSCVFTARVCRRSSIGVHLCQVWIRFTLSRKRRQVSWSRSCNFLKAYKVDYQEGDYYQKVD